MLHQCLGMGHIAVCFWGTCVFVLGHMWPDYFVLEHMCLCIGAYVTRLLCTGAYVCFVLGRIGAHVTRLLCIRVYVIRLLCIGAYVCDQITYNYCFLIIGAGATLGIVCSLVLFKSKLGDITCWSKPGSWGEVVPHPFLATVFAIYVIKYEVHPSDYLVSLFWNA